MTRERVMAGIASIPERAGSLRRTLQSITPQVDQVFLSLNDYPEPPAFLADFPNVTATLRPRNGGDAEKFAAVDEWDGVVATIDDDLLYPPDYIATLLTGLDRHGRDKIVGFHGGKTLGFNGAALAATHKQIRCLGDLDADDTDVNVLGTGALAYDARSVPVWRDVFQNANMADVHLVCHARTFGIPMVALEHRKGWLQDICPAEGRRIYDSNRRGDRTACDTTELREREMGRFDWATAAPARPRVRVSIATCARPELLLELLHDLTRESHWIDLEVAIYEDPTAASYTHARAFCLERAWTWFRFQHRLELRNHWQLVNKELADSRASKAEWFLFLPDDVRLIRHAIARAIDTWQRLADPATLTLWRLRSLEGKTNWTGEHAVQHEHASEIFHVDGLYLCKRPTIDTIGVLADPRPIPGRSSGVGRQISIALHRAGKRMYRADRSLVSCNDGGVSIMNPDERKKYPAIAL